MRIPRGTWSRGRWFTVTGAIVILTVAVIGVVIGVNVAAENTRAEAAVQRLADEEAAERAEAEAQAAAELKEAVSSGEAKLKVGEAHYTDSEAWADVDARANLRTALNELAAVVKDDDAIIDELDEARQAVTTQINKVGTQAQIEARAAAQAAAAQDQQYNALAAQNEGNGRIPFVKGREYCDYLHTWYTPENIYPSLWGDSTEAREIDVAAIQVYCSEYAPVMDQVVAGFYDGKHVVGRDFPAGTYRTWGGVSDCYWERNDGAGNILDNNFVSSAHNGVTVTLRDGEGFVTQGCKLWVPAA